MALATVVTSVLLYAAPDARAGAGPTIQWTIKKIEKAENRASRAADKKKWVLAIRHGEKALEGLRARGEQNTPRYIQTLLKVTGFYSQSGRLGEIEARVEQAYNQARALLGPAHVLTREARAFYYARLVVRKDYASAIRLVQDAMAVLGTTMDEDYRRHRYLKHLYSLYGLTGELALEEDALKRFLALDARLYGNAVEDNGEIIQNLANNYCRQGKLAEFESLRAQHGLAFVCR